MTSTFHLAGSIAEIGESVWDACANPDGQSPPHDPFTTARFLGALETSGSVGGKSGWHPQHLVCTGESGAVVGVMPLYLKHHSQGEYVFDHGWAQAFERAGGAYYPKLQSAVPFTPVTGRRLLLAAGHEGEGSAMLAALSGLTRGNHLSSAHVTFCTEDEATLGESQGFLHRKTQQYHWENPGYRDFDDFLDALSSRKRKNIRKERETAQAFGGDILTVEGRDLTEEHVDALWRFYQNTGARKWGSPYLTRGFFDALLGELREDVMVFLARRNGRYVAGALNFIGRETLFGRYWGAIEDHSCMHFELCYYQAIEAAIARGLRVEAGAQGEHKLARGYLPKVTHSLHFIEHAGFRKAVGEFLVAEEQALSEEIDILTSLGPFKKGGEEDQ